MRLHGHGGWTRLVALLATGYGGFAQSIPTYQTTTTRVGERKFSLTTDGKGGRFLENGELVSTFKGQLPIGPKGNRARSEGTIEWLYLKTDKDVCLLDESLPRTNTSVVLAQFWQEYKTDSGSMKIPLLLAATERPEDKLEMVMVLSERSDHSNRPLIFAKGAQLLFKGTLEINAVRIESDTDRPLHLRLEKNSLCFTYLDGKGTVKTGDTTHTFPPPPAR